MLYTAYKLLLSFLQIRFVREKATLKPVILDAKNYQKAAQVALANEKFSILGSFYSLILLILWSLGGAKFLQDLCEFTSPKLSEFSFILVFLVVNLLLGLPLDIYETFVKDKKFGFSTTNARLFIIDKIKALSLLIVLGGLFIWVILFCFDALGSKWWIYAFILGFGLVLLANLIYPTLIAPIFNKMTPLEDGELKDAINSLLNSCGFRSSGVFVMDASKRDNRLNAYFGGLGRTKRVVLFDTLVKKLETREIIAVLGHELGHFKHKDILKNIAMTFFVLLALFWALGNIPSAFYESLGLKTNVASLIVFFLLYSPILTAIIEPIMSVFSRFHEFGADEFAAKNTSTSDIIRALKKLGEQNKAFPLSQKLYAFVYHSHPSLYERINKLENIASSELS